TIWLTLSGADAPRWDNNAGARVARVARVARALNGQSALRAVQHESSRRRAADGSSLRDLKQQGCERLWGGDHRVVPRSHLTVTVAVRLRPRDDRREHRGQGTTRGLVIGTVNVGAGQAR